MAVYETNTMFSASMPQWQRTYYEAVLLDTIRIKSILDPFVIKKEDFRARDTGIMNYTEVFDLDPNFNALSESTIWLSGAHLDSRSVQLSLEIHGDTLKFSDYSEIVQYVNSGNLRGLVQGKIGQNLVDTVDILARNAFMTHPYPVYAGGVRNSRISITATDVFDPDFAELARVHLEEANIPGVVATDDGTENAIVCITTPRVIHDIRTAASSSWLEVNDYARTGAKFTAEVGTWGGVRFVRTNRMVLKNCGAIIAQTTLNGAVTAGDGAAQTVDTVYSVGQSTSTRYITVASATGFAVGQRVTISSVALNGGAGNPPLESDGTSETRRIVGINGLQISFEKPLSKSHSTGDLMTYGIDLHASAFLGGPAVVCGVGERATPIIPPKQDDMMMINRYGWRGFFKYQMFRPEFLELHFTAGTTN